MVKKFVGLSLAMLILGTSVAAQAEEQLMVLWPKQRAAHTIVMDDHAAVYKARGQAYVDNLYATGGEDPLGPIPDDEIGGEIQPVPINVGQVAAIVKDTEALSKVPALDTQTAATPH